MEKKKHILERKCFGKTDLKKKQCQENRFGKKSVLEKPILENIRFGKTDLVKNRFRRKNDLGKNDVGKPIL